MFAEQRDYSPPTAHALYRTGTEGDARNCRRLDFITPHSRRVLDENMNQAGVMDELAAGSTWRANKLKSFRERVRRVAAALS